MTALLERADLERFREFVVQRLGLQIEDGKLDYLADGLRQRIEASGCHEFAAYFQRLSTPTTGRQELRRLAERLTVTETYFFRNRDQFRVFTEIVLPGHFRRPRVPRQLRVLSAGCSSGEEAYSLAMLVREHRPELASGDVEILGIDINLSVLEKAKRARYTGWSFRETAEDVRGRYFRSDGQEFVIDRAIRTMVTFEERNLIVEDPGFWRRDAFDVVFCRNVTMYFSPRATQAVIARIARTLVPGGLLFLGHAETLRGISDDFHLRQTHGTFYYQRREGDGLRPTVHAPLAVTSAVTPPSLPEGLGPSTSWVEAIWRSSERIAVLTREPTHPPTAGAAPEVRATASARPAASHRSHWDLGLVVELLREERFGDALKIVHALPPEATADPDVLLLHAVLLTNGGALVEAEKVCRKLLELAALSAGAHYLMALCREHAGDHRGAEEQDRSAVYLDPGFAMARLHLGLMGRRAGDLVTARRELEQALILLACEDAARILLFGGGFSREALVGLCRAELQACGGAG